MNTEDTIRQHRTSPIGKSISAVARSLSKRQVFVGTETVASTKNGLLVGDLPLKVAADNRGSLWAYVYSNRDEFSRAFPQGGPFAEMAFTYVFTMVEQDTRFGGIYLNSASELAYPIPREIFDRVRKILKNE